MNPKEHAPGSGTPGWQSGSAGRSRSPEPDEDIADARAARDALAETGAGARAVPAEQAWAELLPDTAGGSEREPGAS